MGNLSEHFDKRDFGCRCRECRGELRIHLGLVGALEAITENYRRKPVIHEAFRCERLGEKKGNERKNSHRAGKAAHISMNGVSLQDLFRFAETVPEIRGIGYYPDEKVLHVDTRNIDKTGEKEKWVKEAGKIFPLTSELRTKYGLS